MAAAVLPGWFLGAALGSRVPGALNYALASACLLWFCVLTLEIRGRARKGNRTAAVCLLAVWGAAGAIAGARAAAPAFSPWLRRGKDSVVTATAPSIPTSAPATFLLRTTRIEAEADPPRWQGRLWAWVGPRGWSIVPGTAVRGIGLLPPDANLLVEGAPLDSLGVAPGTFALFRVRRAFSVLASSDPAPVRPGRVAEIRRRFSARVIRCLGTDAGILAAWTFLGPQTGVPQSWILPFRQTGTLHLLAISGFHMTLLGGLLWVVLKIASGGARWSRWPGLLLLAVYCHLVGAPPPALRAFCGALLIAFAPAWGRATRVWDVLGWTAALLPLTDPALPLGASFRLSVAATAGVFLGGGLGDRLCVLARAARRHAGSGASLPGAPGRPGALDAIGASLRPAFLLLGASAGAALLTTPWLLAHFAVFYPRGVLVNLFAVPAMGTVMVCQLVSILAIALGAEAGHPLVSIGRGTGLGLLGLVRTAAQWSSAVAVPGVLTTLEALGMTLGFAGLLWLASRVAERWARDLRRRTLRGPQRSGSRSGWRSGRPRIGPRAGPAANALCWTALLLVPSTLALWRGALSGRRPPWEMVFLDVGQGDATLLRFGRNAWLVDAGRGSLSGRDRLVPQLLRRRVRRIERVWVTHGDADHWGGIPDLLTAPVAVDTIALPAGAPFPPEFWAALESSPQRPVVVRVAAPWERTLALGGNAGGVHVRVLHPPAPGVPVPARRGKNDDSLVLLLDQETAPASAEAPRSGGGFRALLPGDLEQEREAAVLRSLPPGVLAGGFPVTVELLGHHGSRTAGSEPWWRLMSPALAVISVGRGNVYGLPHAETILAARRQGARVLRLDRTGCVSIGVDGPRARVGRERPP